MAQRQPLSLSSYPVVLALAAIAAAAGAQYAHIFGQANGLSVLLFAGAITLWVIALVLGDIGLGTRIDESVEQPVRRRSVSKGFAAAALLLAALTFATSTDNAFTLDNVSAWFLSVAVFFYAFWQPERSWNEWWTAFGRAGEHIHSLATQGWHFSNRVIIFGLILGVGVFFYYHNLDGVPAEMDSDHAEKILDVNDVLNGARPIFFERNTGREPLEFYLIAGLVEFGKHPLDFMALKLVTATMGLLVIPGTFLFTRELFDDTVAFLSAALIAMSKWPVTIARMGLRFPFTPVLLAPTLFFLVRALKYRRRNDYIMTGLFLGIGLYGYNAFRMAPVLVAAFLVLWPLLDRRMARADLVQHLGNSAIVVVLSLLVFMPLLRYSVDHPENFWYRVLTRISSEERPLSANVVSTVATNVVNASLMFNWTGDQAWPNSIPGDPALEYISGGLFLLGIAYAFYRLIRFRERVYAFVLVGLGVMLLPTALSVAFPLENPSNVRAGGAIPFVFILVALPLAWLLSNFERRVGRTMAVVFIVLVLALIARSNYERYFIDFNLNYRSASWNSSEVAQVIRGFASSVGDYGHAWILLYPNWVDTRNVAINMGDIGWEQTLPNADAAATQGADGANRLYVLNPNDGSNLTRLQELFPNGQLRIYHSATPGKDFDLWYVPGTIAPEGSLGSK